MQGVIRISISIKLKEGMAASAWATRMFERIGRASEICDFTLGNPEIEPPLEFTRELKQVVNNPFPGMHRYTHIAGYERTREAVAETISKESGARLGAEHVIMTAGATGALNIILKALLNPGEEVIVLAPHFVDYPYFIENHGGVCRVVQTNEDFTININDIASAINSDTRAIIINSPHNPTGEIYSEQSLKELGELLDEKSREYGKDIYMISDEPYRTVIYDGIKLPDIFSIYSRTIAAVSYSKQLSIPGERIGYAAVNPEIEDAQDIIEAMTYANRILGYLNAPALMQQVITNLQGVCVDIAEYQERRDILCDALEEFGYSFIRPKGTYYVFPESPVADIVFAKELFGEGIMVNPGTWYGRSGYFRIAFCVKKEMITRSLPGFRKVMALFK